MMRDANKKHCRVMILQGQQQKQQQQQQQHNN
jgi:hypothetical protein